MPLYLDAFAREGRAGLYMPLAVPERVEVQPFCNLWYQIRDSEGEGSHSRTHAARPTRMSKSVDSL